MIYFAQDTLTSLVKIGSTNCLFLRLRELRRRAPVILLGDFDGGLAEEKVLHRIFRYARVRGEWFKPVELLTAVARALYRGEPQRTFVAIRLTTEGHPDLRERLQGEQERRAAKREPVGDAELIRQLLEYALGEKVRKRS